MKHTKKNPKIRLSEIKKCLGNFDLVLPGTLRTLFMKCGKLGCACQKDNKARHGPYHLWDRKVGAKLSSKMLSKSQLKKISSGIEARKKIETLLAEAIVLSQEIAARKIEEDKEGQDA